LVGKYTDQQYCTVTVQNCWSVNIWTNDIARCTCNTVGPYKAPTILLECYDNFERIKLLDWGHMKQQHLLLLQVLGGGQVVCIITGD
jgi:hypothetical protein